MQAQMQAQMQAMQAQTNEQMQAMQAQTNEQMQAMQAQMQAQMQAMQGQMQAMQAQTNGQMQAIQMTLATHNAPAIAAAAATTVQSISASRLANAHYRIDEAFAVVVRSDGTPPPHWPDGFNRTAPVYDLIGNVDSLLADYGLPNGPPAPVRTRRNRLALHLGSWQV